MPLTQRKRSSGVVTWEREAIQVYTTSGNTATNSDIIWGGWNVRFDNCTTGSTATNTANTWRIWNDCTTSNSVTIDTSNTYRIWCDEVIATRDQMAEYRQAVRRADAWDTWNDGWQPTPAPVVYIPRHQETEEQKQDRLRREAEAKARREAEALVRKQANERAEKLLMGVLDDQQRRDWVGSGHFYLHVGDRKYQIRRGQHGNVSLVDKDNRELERFCVLAEGNVPDADNALAQMFMLKHDEAHIIGKANASRIRPGHTSLKQLLREGKPLRMAA